MAEPRTTVTTGATSRGYLVVITCAPHGMHRTSHRLSSRRIGQFETPRGAKESTDRSQ
jgi:hypothetical protein